MSGQLALDVATGLRMSLELGLESLDLFFGQSRTGQVLCVFLVVHDGVEVDHVERRMLVEITAVHGVHHGRMTHGRVEGHRLVHWDAWMGDILVRLV